MRTIRVERMVISEETYALRKAQKVIREVIAYLGEVIASV